jgi:hypothetical protein
MSNTGDMAKRIPIVAIVMIALVGFAVSAAGPFSGSWSSEMRFEPGAALSFASLDSMLTLRYALGPFRSTSESDWRLWGFIWQGFGLTGTLGGFDVQADVLLGPSTGEFLYVQGIVSMSLAGLDIGGYWASLSDAVLGGPAAGGALRLAGSVGRLEWVGITEFGARIRDDDFDGLQIVHAATGLYRTYDTFPISTAGGSSCGSGWTGEKLSVSGWGFGCVEDVAATLYMSCVSGWEWIRFDVEGIDIGLSWLSIDAALTFELQTKSIVLTPTFVLGKSVCVDVYVDVRTDAPDDTLYGPFTSITGIGLYGLGIACSWDGVTVKELTVLDTGRYAITTPEHGSAIEAIADAVEAGHAFYPDYWELLSIDVRRDGCCGGTHRFVVNSYFDRDAGGLLGWGMTSVEGEVAISSTLLLTGTLEVDTSGVDHVGFGFEVGW